MTNREVTTRLDRRRPIWSWGSSRNRGRRWRRCGLIACLLPPLLAASPEGCEKEDGHSIKNPDLEAVLSLQDPARKEVQVFRRKESIRVVLTLRNRTSDTVKLTLPSAQTHDMVVSTKEDKEIWRWSAGRMFAQVLTEVVLPPGESKSFVETWDQTRRDGKPVEPGEYKAVGLIPTRDQSIRSNLLIFTIR